MKAITQLERDGEDFKVEVEGTGQSLISMLLKLFQEDEKYYQIFDLAVRMQKQIIEAGGLEEAIEKQKEKLQSTKVKPLEVN